MCLAISPAFRVSAPAVHRPRPAHLPLEAAGPEADEGLRLDLVAANGRVRELWRRRIDIIIIIIIISVN